MGIIIRRTKEKAIETKKLIFNSALQVFGRKGYSKTTLEDIAKEAELSRGAIYWNFKNKQDLYVNLLKEYFYDNIYEALILSVSPYKDPIEALTEYMYNYIDMIIHNDDVRNFLELLRYKTEVKTEINEVSQVQQEMDLLIKKEISKLVEEAINGEQIRSDIDKEVIVMSILSYLNGIEDTWLMNKNIFPLEKHYRELIKLFIQTIVKH